MSQAVRADCERPALVIPALIWDAMVGHARREVPCECCGLLAGPPGGIDTIYPLANERQSPVAYSAQPADLFAAFRDMRARGAELAAIYHSHPTALPVPSRVDLRENYYGDLPRIIVSLVFEPPVVRAFRLAEDSYSEIPLERLD